MSNITKIAFKGKTEITIAPMYQYDYGQKIKFIDLTLPAAYEVHFSNRERGNAQVVLATSNEVAIPDALLQTGLNIFAWVYLHTGANDGETEYQITIPVIRRAAILDEQPTEQQESAINQAVAALNDAVSTISSKVQAANEAMQNAQSACNLAEIYRNGAEDAAAMLSNVSATATTLEPEQSATASYSQGVFTFGIPQGEQGVKGDTGEPGITYEIDSSVEIIIKDKNQSPNTFNPTIVAFTAYQVQNGVRTQYNAHNFSATIYGQGHVPVISGSGKYLNVTVPSGFGDKGKIVAQIQDSDGHLLAQKTVSCVLAGMNGAPGDTAYLLQTSRNMVVYNPNEAANKKVSPSSITVTSYQVNVGERTLYPVDEITYFITYGNQMEGGSFVASNKVTSGSLSLTNVNDSGYISFSARSNGQTISEITIPIIVVNNFDESITIGSTTLTEENLIKLLELIEE